MIRLTPRFSCLVCFFFNDTATTEIYTGWYTLSLHDALPISGSRRWARRPGSASNTAASTRRSEEHTSELQSHHPISYAVFCLKKKKNNTQKYRSGLPGAAQYQTNQEKLE